MKISWLVTLVGYMRSIANAIITKKKRYCVVCESNVFTFLPFKGGSEFAPDVIRRASVVGSDLDNFSCIRCGSTDRERHLLLYLDKSNLVKKIPKNRLLHIAPEKHLSRYIYRLKPETYIKGDLFPKDRDEVKINIEGMNFCNNYFDVVIANHVLEHVNNDVLALKEVHRVLKGGGIAILQTPYSSNNLDTMDGEIKSAKEKLEKYGQEDHLRLYGLDIFKKIESIGFELQTMDHREVLKEFDGFMYGVNEDEPFMCFRKHI